MEGLSRCHGNGPCRYVLREVVQTWLAVTGVLVSILDRTSFSSWCSSRRRTTITAPCGLLILIAARRHHEFVGQDVSGWTVLAVFLTWGWAPVPSTAKGRAAGGRGCPSPTAAWCPCLSFAGRDCPRATAACVRSGSSGRQRGRIWAASIVRQGGAISAAGCRPIQIVPAGDAVFYSRAIHAEVRIAQCCSSQSSSRRSVSSWLFRRYGSPIQIGGERCALVTLFNGRPCDEGAPGGTR